MKTIYTNTRHPKLIKWSSILAICIGSIYMFVYFMWLADRDVTFYYCAYFGAGSLLYGALFGGDYYLSRYIIDEEADTLTSSKVRKYPIQISRIKTITFKESKKGRFRSLYIHDDGIGFMDIRTTKENAERMTEQLVKAKPSIEVGHANYI